VNSIEEMNIAIFNNFLDILLFLSILCVLIILVEYKFNIKKILKFPWGIDFNVFISFSILLILIIFLKSC